MKSAKRRRVDVNLDELDRVLDGARQAPLSEADCDKLKSALHALAAMLAPSRNTEKTSTVLEEPEKPETSDGTQQVKEVGSGASQRQLREKLLDAARRREIDVVLVWRLDRWGRSVADLLATLQELEHLGVGFVSLTEALDLTTPAGRAMAALLAVFAEFEREILRERVCAGLAHARQNGKRLGRPVTAGLQADKARKLHRAGVSKAEIARRLQIGRTSVRRILT